MTSTRDVPAAPLPPPPPACCAACHSSASTVGGPQQTTVQQPRPTTTDTLRVGSSSCHAAPERMLAVGADDDGAPCGLWPSSPPDGRRSEVFSPDPEPPAPRRLDRAVAGQQKTTIGGPSRSTHASGTHASVLSQARSVSVPQQHTRRRLSAARRRELALARASDAALAARMRSRNRLENEAAAGTAVAAGGALDGSADGAAGAARASDGRAAPAGTALVLGVTVMRSDDAGARRGDAFDVALAAAVPRCCCCCCADVAAAGAAASARAAAWCRLHRKRHACARAHDWSSSSSAIAAACARVGRGRWGR